MTGLCECGCGQPAPVAARTDSAKGWGKGQPKRYIKGHKRTPSRTGADHHRFNGGLSFSGGRWVIVGRDGSRTLYYRAVVAAELGRELRRDEIVHHLNGDCWDDRPENLYVTSAGEHAHIHHARLTDTQVREIRASREPTKVTAARYGITPQYVSQLRTGTAQRRYGMETA